MSERDDLPEVILTQAEVLLLFDAAIQRGDLDRASALAALALSPNDDEAVQGFLTLFDEAIERGDLERADQWAGFVLQRFDQEARS
ncbi:MAG: hypothetical protein ACRDHU_02330 [Actinomycetota bacterium]